MSAVLFETLPCADDRLIGLALLNREKTLNALTLEMIHALGAQLDVWSRNPRIVAVLLRGAGEKAFCAGGDVRALRAALQDTPAPALIQAPHAISPKNTRWTIASTAIENR